MGKLQISQISGFVSVGVTQSIISEKLHPVNVIIKKKIKMATLRE